MFFLVDFFFVRVQGGRTTELEAGTYMGLISVFFTGTALHDVSISEK